MPPCESTHRIGVLANDPANLAASYAALAALRGVDLDTLAAQVEENFHRFFGPD